MIVATEMQNINVNENKVPVQVTETILPPSLDDLDSVVIYKKETCCSLFTDSVYEVCPSEDAKPILLIETPMLLCSMFKISFRLLHWTRKSRKCLSWIYMLYLWTSCVLCQ